MKEAVAPKGLSARQVWSGATAALVIAGFALQAWLGHNPDTSWLLFVARRVLDGAVPYRDILETNPPASFLLYTPVVVLARLIGANEIVVLDGLVGLATAASLLLSGLILERAEVLERSRTGALLFSVLLILLVLPMTSFAQREQIAVLADLPILAALGVRSLGGRPGTITAILAGLGAGVAIAIKPVFAIALAGPLIFCLMAPASRRLWDFVELWVAAGIALLYGALVVLLYPDFEARMLPLVTEVYLPARLDLIPLLTTETNLVWLALAGLFWRASGFSDAVGRILIAASAGFEAAVLIQGKGFLYHGYPAVALAAVACAVTLLRPTVASADKRLGPLLRIVPAVMVAIAGLWVFEERYDVETQSPGLTRAIAAVSPQPRLLTIGAKIALGQSFARTVGAEWVGSEPDAWITYFSIAQGSEPNEPARHAAEIDLERGRYARDIRDRRPDVILIDGPWWMAWIRRSPDLIDALASYQDAGRFGRVALLRRKPQSPETPKFAISSEGDRATMVGTLP